MSDKSNEQISNLMDGELEINASKFLLKRMASDDSLSKTWSNYHLIKSCLQKETAEPIIDIASRVTQQLKNESDGYSQRSVKERKPHINRWLKPIMGIGIAASVAFMSVTMLQNQKFKGTDSPVIASKIVQSEFVSPIFQTNISATTASSGTALVPPPSLSRFPSSSINQQASFGQGQFYNNTQTPYIILINKSASVNNKQLSPIRIQDVSD